MTAVAFKRGKQRREKSLSVTMCSQLPAASLSCDCSPAHCHNSQNQLFKIPRIAFSAFARQTMSMHNVLRSFHFICRRRQQQRRRLNSEHPHARKVKCLVQFSLFFKLVLFGFVHHVHFSHILFPSKMSPAQNEICVSSPFVANMEFLEWRWQLFRKLRAQSAGERLSFVAR